MSGKSLGVRVSNYRLHKTSCLKDRSDSPEQGLVCIQTQIRSAVYPVLEIHTSAISISIHQVPINEVQYSAQPASLQFFSDKIKASFFLRCERIVMRSTSQNYPRVIYDTFVTDVTETVSLLARAEHIRLTKS